MRPYARWRGAAIAIVLASGCGGAPKPEDETAKREAKRLVVVRASCLREATESGCRPGRELSFDGDFVKPGQRVVGSISCEGGRPHARMSLGGRDVSGEIAQVTWEAIWRIVEVSDSCVSAFRRPVMVNGRTRACERSELDVGFLVVKAYEQAKSGPPRHDPPLQRICELQPDECGRSDSPCPRFDGDVWNGRRKEEPRRPSEEPDSP